MNDDVWKRAEIASPCVKVCLMHPDAKLCTGCLRTGDEIALWSRYSDDERRAIMDELPSRKAHLTRRRGGRAARLNRSDDRQS
ncbi:MAG: DUF1289 domain-containing protein [Pseudooceanicola sp.]